MVFHQPLWKICASQIGFHFPPRFRVKIKNIWNHHPVQGLRFFSIETIVGIISYLFLVYAGSKKVGTWFFLHLNWSFQILGFFSLLTSSLSAVFSAVHLVVFWLVVSTHLKNISQIGNLPQIGVKIKNIWNHHLVFCRFGRIGFFSFPPRRFGAQGLQLAPLGPRSRCFFQRMGLKKHVEEYLGNLLPSLKPT